MDPMNLQVAIIDHLQWQTKLSDFFYGVEDLSPSAVPDHHACNFGKWLYPQGMRELAGFADLNSMEMLHKELHGDIKGMLMMSKETRKSDTGKQALAAFKQKCDRFVTLLENMQRQAEKN
jgi:hypothetical protein